MSNLRRIHFVVSLGPPTHLYNILFLTVQKSSFLYYNFVKCRCIYISFLRDYAVLPIKALKDKLINFVRRRTNKQSTNTMYHQD